MKNRGVWILLTLVVVFGALVVWDLNIEKSEEEKKKVASQLITLKQDQIHQIQVTNSNGVVLLKKTNEGWNMIEPLQDSADQKIVEELLSSAADEKSTDQVAEGDQIDWKVYGLDQPKAKIQYTTNSGENQGLDVSSLQNFEFNAFVRRAGENKVFTASSSWQTKLDKKINDFRDKSLFRHKVANIESLKVENKNGKYKLSKTRDQWQVENHTDWILDATKVKEITDSLSDAHINDLINEGKVTPSDLKKYELQKPLATLEVRFHADANLPAWNLKVSKMKDDHYAFIEKGNVIYKLDPISLSNVINSKAEEFRDKSLPFKFNLTQAQKIELKTNLKKYSFLKKGSDWTLADQAEKFTVNAENIKNLLNKMSSSKATSYESEKANKGASFDNQVILKDEKDQELFELSWSSKPIKKDSKTTFMARSSVSPEAFTLDESTINGYSLQGLVEEKK